MAQRSLAGQVAIVTGASSGIGAALARALACQGVRVALVARRAAQLEQVASEIVAGGGQALAIPADVTDPVQVGELIERVVGEWGRLDILVANAGIYVQAAAAELTLDHLEQAMRVNYFGAMIPTLAALPIMRRQSEGHLVFIASQAVNIPIPPDGPYVASKAALSGLAQVLRQELAPEGIAVTVVYPGRIDTPLIAHLRTPFISPKASPERLARRIVRGIRRKEPRIVFPISGYLYLLRELSPAVGDWLIAALHLQGWPVQQSHQND